MEDERKIIGVISTVHNPNDTRIYHRQIPSFLKAGYQVFFFCKEKPNTSNGCQIVELPNFKNRFLRILFSTFITSLYALKHIQIDLFLLHDPELIPTGIILKLFGKKIIFDIHEDYEKVIQDKIWLPSSIRQFALFNYIYFERIAIDLFDLLLAVTPEIASKYPSHKTILVQNFPTLDEIPSKIIPFNKRENWIIYVGRISQERGITNIINALELIESDVKLILIGEVSSDQYLAELQLLVGWKKVDYLGYQNRDEVYKYLCRSKLGLVCFLPTTNHVNAQPNKMYEYMAAGLPILVSNFDKWVELIKACNCGMPTNPVSVPDIAQQIEHLLKNDSLAEKMVINANKNVLSKFNWELEERVLLQIIQVLI